MIFTTISTWKTWKLWWYSRNSKIKMNTSGFDFWIFEFREYEFSEHHLRFSSLSCRNSREYHLKFPNKSMKSSSQNKKNIRGLCWNTVLVIFLPKIQRLVFYIIALIKFSSQHIVFSSFILILVLYSINNTA